MKHFQFFLISVLFFSNVNTFSPKLSIFLISAPFF